MFDREEIANAVEIQNRAYRLLRWVSDAIERGFIRFDRAHQYASEADAAADWISEHYANVPPDCRPPSRSPRGVGELGAYFLDAERNLSRHLRESAAREGIAAGNGDRPTNRCS